MGVLSVGRLDSFNVEHVAGLVHLGRSLVRMGGAKKRLRSCRKCEPVLCGG
jgi:hypothetical protein